MRESSRELNDKNKPVHTMREFHLNFPTAFNDFLPVHCLYSIDGRFLVVIPHETKLVFHLDVLNFAKLSKSIFEIFHANAAIKRCNIDLAFNIISEVTIVMMGATLRIFTRTVAFVLL